MLAFRKKINMTIDTNKSIHKSIRQLAAKARKHHVLNKDPIMHEF